MQVQTNPVIIQKKKNKKNILVVVLTTIILFMGCVNFWSVEKRNSMPFFENTRPMVIAHQGGEDLAPSNTMVAFQQAVDMGVDALEFDIHITKDGELVTIHDPTVDRTTEGVGKVADMTLEQIQKLDAGYQFQDLDGNFSFRGKGVYIPTVEEVFSTYPNMKMVMEIKDDNPREKIEEIAAKLWKLIETHKLQDKVLIAAFDQSIVDTFNSYSKGKVAIAGGKQEIKKFVVYHTLFLRNLYQPKVDAIEIPTKESIFDLTEKRLIDGAHRRGMDVHYWTIDDKAQMKQLIEKGADGIITNRPDLMLQLLDEMGY
ncbi:glycerophosphodiester phosphodiesterase [Peribacillus alkalitolerans]|uniref:glycerophosphodiester phosphodiesterase n=1 Tax=Peribacillus alkalitolerans TaxID=1550385 RepID=UPI0013D3A012|nr:glycerophosphodiester phosphodiesterase [Peribacillus alkalitolerans]